MLMNQEVQFFGLLEVFFGHLDVLDVVWIPRLRTDPFFFSKIAKNYVISSIHQKTTKIGFVPPILGKIHF